MRESFLLTLRALARGHVLTVLLAALALVHATFPALVRGDGTADGAREMFLRAVPGSVVALVLVSLLSCACGLFARERDLHRLAQTVIRPVSSFSLALGRWLALCTAALLLLAANAAVVAVRCKDAPDCRHHHSPALPPPAVVARQMMEEYLNDPNTPEAVKKAPRRAVLALLTNKESDRYDVVPPGGRISWPFNDIGLGADGAGTGVLVRVCFASAYSMRSPVRGTFILGEAAATVSNDTQSVVDIPLAGMASCTNGLVFANAGKDSVMLRPRRDLELLLPADGFMANLLRATLLSFSTAALLAAFGLFLSAALSRPVALFTAMVLVAVALMAPSAIEQFPDELNVSLANRIGLALSRGVAFLTSAFAEPSPVADLATSRCIEWPELARTLVMNVLVLPLLLLGMAARIVRSRPLSAK